MFWLTSSASWRIADPAQGGVENQAEVSLLQGTEGLFIAVEAEGFQE